MNAINTNEQMIQKINEVLLDKRDAIVNIVNDKLTISVFSLLEKNLQNVKEINFVIRDVKFLPHQSEMDNFQKTDNILNDVQNIIEVSQKEAYRSVNTILSQRNWLIGYRIAAEELAGEERAEYGVEIIKNLSKNLTQKYGKGYDRSNLYHCLRFYKAFPQIVDTVCRQSDIKLTWSHYRTLL